MSIYKPSEFEKEIKRNPENFYIIHYSCQSLYDDTGSLSPRITSIAINHYSTEQQISFSTHATAEQLHIDRNDVEKKFDEIELKLLTDFYEFIRDIRGKYWLHWNMRNIKYGFEHLEHRYTVLGGKNKFVIPVERRLNLNDLLNRKYGTNYAKDPKLKSLMELNGGIHRDFLDGKQEVEAFEKKEYIKMHSSTLCKVGFMHLVIRKYITGKLKTSSRGIGVKLDKLLESRTNKTLALSGTLIGIISALNFFLQLI